MTVDFGALILNEVPDGIMVTGPDGNIVHWTKGAAGLFGFGAGEAIGKPHEFLIPSEAAQAERAFREKILGAGVASSEGLRRRKDGSLLYVQASAKAVPASDGEAPFILYAEKDITEIKASRDARAVETRFGPLLELMPDAIVIINAAGRIVLTTSRADNLFGYEPGELRGMELEKLLPEPFRRVHVADRAGYFTQPRVRPMGIGMELFGMRKDGRIFPVEISLAPLETDEGTLAMSAIRDITLRKKAESRFRGLLESAPDAMVIANSGGEITLVNSQTERLFGYSREALLGQPVEMLLPERFRAGHPGLRKSFFDAPRARPMGAGRELFGLRADGSEFPIDVNLSPIESEEGVIVASAIRDVTDRRRIEQTLLEKNMELENANLAKDRFLASMSHELRTPLNAIIGFSELLADGVVGELTPEQKGVIGDILTSGEHLLSLINDILDLSKVEAGKMTLDLESVDVDALVQASVMVVRERAMDHGMRVTIDVERGLTKLWGDPRKLKQILYNLLSNAVKFTPDGGEVRVEARRVDASAVPSATFPHYLEVKVRDTGIGIPAAAIGNLFQPFSQADSSLSRRFEGTGLGLAMVKKLTVLHGGEVAVESAVDRGSTFTVWIPWREEASDAACQQAEERAPASVPQRGATARAPLALIVEDDPLAANLLRMVLENDGFRVASAASAEEGLEAAAREKPDVIALDIMLPGMSGWEFLARIKAQPQLADIPVVIETVLSQTEKGTALGAARVLQKPLRRADLEEALHSMGFGLRHPGERLRVLVADDDEKTMRLLASYLQAAGMEVLEAHGGAEAIEMARREHPNLLVLDLMMPQVSGFDVVEALKDDPSMERMPILVVTAKETTAAERTALNGNVQSILEKSKFDRRHFLNEVKRAVNTRGATGDVAHGTHPGR